MKGGRMQAKDITDREFMDACASVQRPWGVSDRWSIARALGVPEKVALAKARRVMGRGLIAGCACGCRGDFEIVGQLVDT